MNSQRVRRILYRGLTLKCPACGETALYHAPFRMWDHCSFCGLVFEREQGYFVGAIYVNVIATEAVLVSVYVASFLRTPVIDESVIFALLALAVTLPLIFYHHSRSLWLSFDYLLGPPEDQTKPDTEIYW